MSFHELKKKGLIVERQKKIDIVYDDLELKSAFKTDLIITNKLLVELKSVSAISPIDFAQTITYMKLTNIKLSQRQIWGFKIYKFFLLTTTNEDILVFAVLQIHLHPCYGLECIF